MKKYTLLLIVITVFGVLPVYSQTTNAFRINYDQALFDLPGNATESLTANQYVFAGTNLNFFPIYGTVTELDAVGDLVWSKRYYDGSFGFQINDIKKDNAANEYYVCGGSESNAGVFMRLDAAGNVIVSTKFEINEADGAYLNRIIKASDGGYVAVGYVTGHDPDGAGPETYFGPINYTDADGDPQTEIIGSPLIVKFDASGNHQWHHITRYYTTIAANPADRIYNDASFSDVVEVGDGFIAVGQYDVNQHLSNTNSDGDDATATDAVIFKTDLSGAILYHRQIDNPNTSPTQSSNYLSAINKTSVGDPIAAGGTGGGRELIQKYGALGGFSLTFSRRFTYASSFFGVDPVDISQVYEVNGGTDIVTMGMYIKPFSFIFSNSLHRYNGTATSTTWAKYFTFGLATILPRGQQTSDNGFIMASTTLGASFDYQVIKTDPNGDTPLTDCAAISFNPAASAGPTTIGSPNQRVWSGTPQSNGLAILVTNITPIQNVICRATSCTPPPLADNVTATPNPICAGDDVTIDASGPGTGVSYTVYTAPTGGTNLGGVPLVVSPGTTTTYYIETVNDSDPLCVSVSRVPIEVVVNASTNPTFNQIAPICAGETFSLLSTSLEGVTGTWFPAINNTVTTEYTFTPDGGQCATSTTMTVVVNDPVTPTFNQVTPICIGDAFTLPTPSLEGITGTWSPAINNTVTTEYTFTPGAGQCATTSTMTVVVGDPVTPTFNQVAPICVGDVFTLPTPSIEGYTGSWSPAINNTVTTEYTFTPDAGQCATTTTMTVAVGDPVTPTFDQIDPICSGDAISLLTTSLEGFTGSWSPAIDNTVTTEYTFTPDAGQCASTTTMTVVVGDPVTPTFDPVGPICTGDVFSLLSTSLEGFTGSWSPAIDNTVTTEYTFTPDAGQCASTTTMTVVISAGPSLSISGNDISCFGENDGDAEVVATGDGPFNYSWSPSGGSSATASNLSADSYTVTVTDDNGCSNTENITINEPAELTLSTSATQSSCTVNDGTATVVASGGSGSYTYSWSSGGNSDVEANIGAGVYTITVTDANGCTAQENVTVGSVNGPTLTLLSSENISCFGGNDGSAAVEATGGTPGYTYNWVPSGGNNTSATGLGAGTYTATVTDDAGCTAALQVTISEPAALLVTGNATDANCGLTDGTITASVIGGTGSYSYTWTPNVGNTAAVSGLSGGTYSLTVEDANGCQVSTTFNVGVTGTIPIDVIPDITTIEAGDNVDLEVIIGGGVTGASIIWTPSTGLSCTTCPNPNASPNETTTYYVAVTTADGCFATDSVIVFVTTPCGQLFIPNIFSPNNDGNNDMLCIYGGCIESIEFAIYSRWGQKVFETTDPNECWDGTYKDKPMNSETFVYKMVIKLAGESEQILESGNINLVR